jgi:hypothetical protein
MRKQKVQGKPHVRYDEVLTREQKAKIMALRLTFLRVRDGRLPREVMQTKEYRQLITDVQWAMLSKHTERARLMEVMHQADELYRVIH